MKSQSALQPRLLDEKVSGVVLVDWAAWAASTTFSFTGHALTGGRWTPSATPFATFLGVSEPAVSSEDLRGKQFSTPQLLGYDKTEVEAFVEAAGLRLAAMESTDRPAGAPVSGGALAGWAEWVESTKFSRVTGPACKARQVDAFQKAIRDTFLEVRKPPLRSDEVLGKQFPSTDADHGVYDKWQVAASSMRPPSGWRRWSLLTGRKNHWLAVPFSPGGPSGPTRRDSRLAAVCGRATRRRRSTHSGKRFVTRFLGSSHPL